MSAIKPIHPGKILYREFLKPYKISQYKLAKDISVPAVRINDIINEKRAITADTALRLAAYFGNSSEFWLGLQKDYELDMARITLKNRLKKEVHPFNFEGEYVR